MRKPWNLPSYPVYSLMTWKEKKDNPLAEVIFHKKQEVRWRKNISKWAYIDISDQEISFSEDEIRRFSGNNMNIMTYVIPVSMSPKHYILAIYHDTQSLENWWDTRRGILQILAPEHVPLVRVLGKKSGKSYDKMAYLGKKSLLNEKWILKNIAWYIELEEIEKFPDGWWDHALYLCRVVSSKSYHERVLETKYLIEQKIIL